MSPRVKIELVHFNVAVQHFSHYATGTLPLKAVHQKINQNMQKKKENTKNRKIFSDVLHKWKRLWHNGYHLKKWTLRGCLYFISR